MDTFNKEAFERHNKYRDIHQAPPLKYSAKLAADAQAHADKMAASGSLGHAKTDAGENIAYAFGQNYTGGDATDSWYSEVKDYDFSSKQPNMKCGHFTQVVWKTTTEAGFGKATDKKGAVFICGRYMPAGNNMSAYAENVLNSKTGKIILPEKPEPKPSAAQPASSSPSHHQHHHHGAAASSAPAASHAHAKSPGDQLVGKKSASKTDSKGVTIITTTETFKKADGSTYTVETETKK